MADGDPAPTPAPTPTPAPAPWYTNLADPETIGHWQNKVTPDVMNDPIKLAIDMSKRYREAERHIGVPPDQLLRLPKDAKDEAGWNTVWTRLGQPKQPADYDLSAVKFADGTAIDPGFEAMIRQTAFSNHIPKDAATAFAQSVVKFMETADASEQTEYNTKLEGEKAMLAKSWGPNAELNKLTAMQGAKRLGVSPEEVAALEKGLGYAKVMEMFRKVGDATSEDTFQEGTSGHNPKTAASAQARLAELQNDTAWAKRLTAGDAQARREFDALIEQISGVSYMAETAA